MSSFAEPNSADTPADRGGQRWVQALGTGIFVSVLAAGYFAVYRALVMVSFTAVFTGIPPAYVRVQELVEYRSVPPVGQEWCRTLFGPAEWLDRRLRPQVWNR